MKETHLILSIGDFPPFSARECEQILELCPTGELRRTINGDLVYLGRHSHRKYQSVISCKDKEPPALNSAWKGQEVTVACVQRLWQKAVQTTVTLERQPREGSVICLDGYHRTVQPTHIEGRSVTIPSSEGILIGYQPILRMYIVDFSLKYQEWEDACGWTLKLMEA